MQVCVRVRDKEELEEAGYESCMEMAQMGDGRWADGHMGRWEMSQMDGIILCISA
jgi:hypothetical protein